MRMSTHNASEPEKVQRRTPLQLKRYDADFYLSTFCQQVTFIMKRISSKNITNKLRRKTSIAQFFGEKTELFFKCVRGLVCYQHAITLCRHDAPERGTRMAADEWEIRIRIKRLSKSRIVDCTTSDFN